MEPSAAGHDAASTLLTILLLHSSTVLVQNPLVLTTFCHYDQQQTFFEDRSAVISMSTMSTKNYMTLVLPTFSTTTFSYMLWLICGGRLCSAAFALRFNGYFPDEPRLTDFIGAKHDGTGSDNWSYRTCRAPVKSSPPTNQHPTFYRLDALPLAKPTVSKN